MDYITGFLIQIFSTVGIIVIFGWIIALLRRGFCALAGVSGPKILLATGIIGTPIHELSHALMCLLFGHRITEIKLYQPRSNDGTLGYVSHTYNKKNIYHQIGNFFIGIAPILVGGAFVALLMSLLINNSFESVMDEISILSRTDLSELPISEYFSFLISSIGAIFSLDNFTSWQGWLFIVLAVMISTHMELSGSDIKSGAKGFLFIALLLLLADGIIYLASPDAFAIINEKALSFGLILSALLSISVLFLAVLLLLALLIRLIISIFSR